MDKIGKELLDRMSKKTKSQLIAEFYETAERMHAPTVATKTEVRAPLKEEDHEKVVQGVVASGGGGPKAEPRARHRRRMKQYWSGV